jgi:hypothetical protein
MPYTLVSTSTPSKLPYRQEVYQPSLSEAVAEIVYQYCHANFSKRIEKAFADLEIDDGEAKPSTGAISTIVKLIERVSKTEPLFEPEVTAFGDEASVTWRFGKREVTLLARGAAEDPKMLLYESRENQPSYHRMFPNVTERDLLRAIGCSRRYHGWLYE